MCIYMYRKSKSSEIITFSNRYTRGGANECTLQRRECESAHGLPLDLVWHWAGASWFTTGRLFITIVDVSRLLDDRRQATVLVYP